MNNLRRGSGRCGRRLDFSQKHGDHVPLLTGICDDSDRLAVVFGDDAGEQGMPIRLKRYFFTDAEVEHVRMGAYFTKEPQTRDHSLLRSIRSVSVSLSMSIDIANPRFYN